MKKIILLLIIQFSCNYSFSLDSLFVIKVHFLYGSKPKMKFKDSETRWFGGVHGGHVGIEVEKNQIFNFIPNGDFHIFNHERQRNSKFVFHDSIEFWKIFGVVKNVKKASIIIPITKTQKQDLEKIVYEYSNKTPYDYAFFGMRCGAATYDLLSKIGILKKVSNNNLIFKVFYPKRLRKMLFKLSLKKKWVVLKKNGSTQRIWEKD